MTILGCSGGHEANTRVAGLVYGSPTVVGDNNGQQVVVDILTQYGKMTVSSHLAPPSQIAAIKTNLVKGNLVDWVPYSSNTEAMVADDPSKTFNVILSKSGGTGMVYSPAITQFDSMKYGPEVTPVKGVPGAMVAAGWVYAKTAGTITVGDGRVVDKDISGRALAAPSKRYEETYNVASNAKVFNVRTDDYSLSDVSDFNSIPVTADYSYTTTSRQAAYLVFDRNYQDAANAKVVAIWYFTPKAVSDGLPVWDVPTQSSLLADKGADPVSGKNYIDIVASGVTAHPYTRSTEPFEIVKNTFYWVGDNEVAVYLFNCDMGTPSDKSDDRLVMLDAGWPNSGYQYWKNIEAMGFDPRNITDWMGTHGHGDHYGAAGELIGMVENAGRKLKVWGSPEDTFGITKDAQGNTWNIAGALPTTGSIETMMRARTVAYPYDQWMDYGNVQIMVTPTPGHTPGTDSFFFKVKDPVSGKSFVFGYDGGYGFNGLEKPSATNGWLRLNFQLGLAWLQQKVPADYVSPQHTNQYPMVEAYQALKAYNNDPANASKKLTMLDALTSVMPDSTGGTTELVNFCEKRYAVSTNAVSDSQPGNPYKSIETGGPFKPGRASGLTVRATLKDGGKIIQGFNKYQNKNPKIPLLANGIVISKDSYVHDPDGWYVQFYIDVLDDQTYKGFLPASFVQGSITYAGGPVESLHTGTGTPEVLRTQRLASKADAEKILASVTNGGTYTIQLTPASAIVVPTDVTKTFQP